MARRPAADQGDTLNTIRQAAFSLFGQYGYDGVSMLAVARAARVTKAALYWHFDGKQALYADCMRQLNALFGEHVLGAMRAGSTPIRRLQAAFDGMATLLDDARVRRGVAGYWLTPSTADVADALAEQAQFERVSSRLIAQTIGQAVAAGELRLDIPVQDMAETFIGTMEAIVLPLRRNEPERGRRMIDVLSHTFFQAYASGQASRAEPAGRRLAAAG